MQRTTKKQRTWQAGKPRKKPDYDPETVTRELLDEVTALYSSGEFSLQTICNTLPDCHLNPMKVRKLLITAGVYEGQDRTMEQIETVKFLHEQGMSIDEISVHTGLSRSTVHSYLPYTKIIYKLDSVPGGEKSVDADRQTLYRKRKKACEQLRENPCTDTLWEAIRLFAGYPFQTAQGLSFTYGIKPNRYGKPGNEIVFSRREKSITKATVEKAYERVRELNGRVAGPKMLGYLGQATCIPCLSGLV